MSFELIKSGKIHRNYSISLCISLLLAINIFLKQTTIERESYPSNTSQNVTATVSKLVIKNNTPYLTFIISAVPARRNFTMTTLNTRLPGFFHAKHWKTVSKTDPRIFQSGGIHAASLMLTYLDLWKDISLKAESELADDDWVFLFEDDVDIVPLGILEAFYNEIYTQWNKTNPSKALAGRIDFDFIAVLLKRK